MATLLEVAACGHVGDLVTAIYAQCADLNARRDFHSLAQPYFETILRRFDHKELKYSLTFGQLRTLDGSTSPAYMLTMTRADHLVTKWALFVNEQDKIIRVVEQDPDLPTDTITRH